MSLGVLMMSEKNCTDKIEEQAVWRTNTCLKCDRKFQIRDWKHDDVRFVRFCNACRATVIKRSKDVEYEDIF